jgi:hypothetical protein
VDELCIKPIPYVRKCFGLELGGGKRQAARRNGMGIAACRSGDAKLKTEAPRDCVSPIPSATSSSVAQERATGALLAAEHQALDWAATAGSSKSFTISICS